MTYKMENTGHIYAPFEYKDETSANSDTLTLNGNILEVTVRLASTITEG